MRLKGRTLVCCLVKFEPHEEVFIPMDDELDIDFKLVEFTESGHPKEERLLFSKSSSTFRVYSVSDFSFDHQFLVILYDFHCNTHCEIRSIDSVDLLLNLEIQFSNHNIYANSSLAFSNGLIFNRCGIDEWR